MKIKEGDSVTWGSGEPAGRVEVLYEGTNPQTAMGEPFARIAMTKDITSPCGRTWAAGTVVRLPLAELRLLS